MEDRALPEVSVHHVPSRRLSWTSVQLSEVAHLPEVAAQSRASSVLRVTPASLPPPPAGVPSTSSPAATALSPVTPRRDTLPGRPPDPTPVKAPPPPAPPPPPATEALTAQLQADSDTSSDITILGVALVANCHVSLVIFGLLFLAAGSLLCVISFRAPTSAEGDVQSRVAGTFFLCLAAVMCTFGLCLCRLDQQISRRDQERGASDCGDCHIHEDTSRCHRVLPSIQRAKRSTLRMKRNMVRQLDGRWMSATGGRQKEKSFSSIELLSAASGGAVGCGRCNEALQYGSMEKTDVASFPS